MKYYQSKCILLTIEASWFLNYKLLVLSHKHKRLFFVSLLLAGFLFKKNSNKNIKKLKAKQELKSKRKFSFNNI